MAYAVDTSVPVERSKQQIELLLCKYGAEGYHTGWQAATNVAEAASGRLDAEQRVLVLDEPDALQLEA